MANRYWVGGTGNTNDTTHWAATSGGAGSAGVPTSADDVFFDALSGTGTCTVNAALSTKSVDCTGYTGTLTLGAQLSVFGNLTLASGMTFNGNFNVIAMKATSGSWNITTAGKTLWQLECSASGGTWTLQDNLTCGNALGLYGGTLNTNGKTCTLAQLDSATGSAGRVLNLGASSITCSHATTPVNMNVTQGSLTLNAGTSTITCTGTGATFAGGGKTFNNVVLSGAGTQIITGTNTFANLTRTGTAAKTDALSLAANQTVTGTFTVTGNGAALVNRVLVTSDTVGTARTITAAVVTLTNGVNFRDITGAGAGSWTGTSLGDCLGNSGITFTGAVTRYGVVAGNFSSTATWSTTSGGAGGASIPLPQDTVILDANSAAGTYTTDMPHLCKDITCTGFTRTLNFSLTGGFSMYGSLTLASGMTVSGGNTLALMGRSSSHTITSATKSLAFGATINAPGGTYTLQDDLTVTPANVLILTAGTLDANGKNVSVGRFSSTGSATRSFTLSGTATMALSGTGTVWDVSAALTLTVASGTTIVLSDTSASTKTFNGGSKTYGIVSITTAGSGSVTFTGSNTFVKLTQTGGSTKTVIFTAGTTTTLTGGTDAWFSGVASNLITITSTAAGSAATVSKASGIISSDYLSLKDMTVTGGVAAYAGANSTNVSGNTGWLFRAVNFLSPGGVGSVEAIGLVVLATGQTLVASGIVSAEALGNALLALRFGASSVGSSETLGAGSLAQRFFAVGKTSDEALSAAALAQRFSAAGKPGEEALGVLGLIQLVKAAGKSSDELFGLVGFGTKLGLPGISSLDAFGSPGIVYVVSPAALGPAEAFGAVRFAYVVVVAEVSSGQSFGTPLLLQSIVLLPVSIASGFAPGSSALALGLKPGGISTSQALGLASIAQRLHGTGLASGELFGAVSFPEVLRALGIATAEGSGSPSLALRFRPIGRASEQAFGGANLARLMVPDGVPSTAAVGTARLALRLIAAGVPSEQAFGLATLIILAALQDFGASRAGAVSGPSGGDVADLSEGAADSIEAGTLLGSHEGTEPTTNPGHVK